MSHAATNWAIQQKGIKPALKVVLWHLCDRHHPDNGCYPSQDTLAEDCEVSRSALNTYLDELEERGLIARERRRRAGSNRQERTRYYFPFDAGFDRVRAEKPCPESGHGSVEAVSENEQKPSPEIAESRVQNLDSNPVREPVIEPVMRESAREAERKNEDVSPEAVRRAFKRWYPSWPSFVADSEPEALKAWIALSADERLEAAERTAAYCDAVRAAGRKLVCSAGVYLREKRWEKIPPPVAPVDLLAQPFGKAWSARRLRLLAGPSGPIPKLSGFKQRLFDAADRDGRAAILAEHRAMYGWPAVQHMHRDAAEARPVTASASDHDAGREFVQVRVGSDVFEAWRALHAELGFPWLPDMGRQEWIYFPALPDGGDLAARVRAAFQRYAQRGVSDDAA